MKKYLVIVSLVIGFVSLGLLFGCAQTTETTTTTTCTATTTTTAASTTTTTSTTTTSSPKTAYVSAAKAGAVVASGTSYAGQAVANTSVSKGLSVASIKAQAQAGGPPSGFFTAVGSDGFAAMETGEVVGGNLVPYLRLRVQAGPVTSATLANKKIASFEAYYTLQQQMNGQVTNQLREAAFAAWVTQYKAAGGAPYGSAGPFRSLSSIGDYTAWSFMYPSMEGNYSTHPSWEAGMHFTTPEAISSDKISSMECKMVFQKSTTGEISVILPVVRLGDPMPAGGTYSGSGNLLLPGSRTLEATAVMVMTQSGPHTVEVTSVNIYGPIKPENYSLWMTLPNPMASGNGTGIMSNEAGSTVATLEITSSGGTIYWIGPPATSETFTL